MSDVDPRTGEDAAPGRISSREVYRGRVVDLYLDDVRFPDGSTGTLELIRHSGAAAVVPLLSDPREPDPEILLIHQYRYAAGGRMLEVPAGRPDRPGEDWELCARRELEEETGLVAGSLRRLTTIFTTPGFTNEQIHLFLATDLTAGRLSLDADEFVEPVRLRMSDALRKVESGDITDAKTICALLYTACFALRRGA